MSEKDILSIEKDQLPNEEEVQKILSRQKNLALQSFKTIEDKNSISPLTQEIISRQATMNIGTIGHVAHGKTTLVRAVSGIQTTKHKIEKERNITYVLGYANAKLYKCPKCPEPDCYKSAGSDKEDKPKCDKCDSTLELLRHISFVDCPGHDILMATMLNGAAVMDAALLLVASNEPCPQPQTSEHLAAVENMDLENIIIIQNKIDLIKEETAKEHYNQIKNFVQGTKAAKSPIIPISAQLKYNIDSVIYHLVNLPIPKRDFISPPRFIIVRSFDINHPGEDAENLKGGVAGGTLIRGVLRVGEIVEIRPGIISKDETGIKSVNPIYSRIISLKAEENDLIYAIPGGLIGVGLKVDPSLTIKNRLVGKFLGHPGHLPDIYLSIVVKTHLLKRILGIKRGDKSTVHIGELRVGDVLLVNAGSTAVGSTVKDIKGENNNIITFNLSFPICSEISEKVAISKKIGHSWRLIGWGEVLEGGKTIPNSQ
jgi:translation initiation factor 2 subunit 3